VLFTGALAPKFVVRACLDLNIPERPMRPDAGERYQLCRCRMKNIAPFSEYVVLRQRRMLYVLWIAS
jgi:hypothetical protein